jgi:hypothetical protein
LQSHFRLLESTLDIMVEDRQRSIWETSVRDTASGLFFSCNRAVHGITFHGQTLVRSRQPILSGRSA